MALAGELVNYIGGELVKNTGKELASKATTSALSNLIPKLATNATNNMAKRIGNEVIAGSMLGKLVPKNRMLDKSGKPVTLYHSTPNDFDKFDDAMLGSNTGYDNTALGHFVTPDLDFSKRFRDINNTGKPGRTMELQANVKNTILHPYMAGYKYKDPAVRDKIVEDYLLATDNQVGLDMLRDYLKEDAAEFGKDANLYNEYMAMADDPGGEGPFFSAGDERELLKKKGYDAVELIEGPKSGLVEGAKSDAPVSSYAVFSGDSLRPVRHIPVEGSSSLSSIIPVKRKLYRGQQYSNTDFSYNSELMNENPDKWGSKDVGKGYHFTPKKGMAGSWEGSDGGVIEVDYTPDQVLKADDARKMIKEANELLADDKYMAKLWQENEAMAEQIEEIADGNLEALAKREGKPFVQHLKANDDELGTMYYYKDIDPELTDRFVSEFKKKAEKYMPKRASANGDDMVTLFHNTKAENIPSIMEQGLIPGKRPEGYLASPEEAGIWTDDRGLKSGSYGGTTVKIRVPKKEFDATRVNDTQNLLNRAIKPSEIEGVDYMLYDTPLIKNSNLQEYIDKYGENKVRELIEKKGLVSPEVIDKSFSDLKSGMPSTKPNIQQSKVELSPQQQEFFKDSVVRNENGELIPMYHGSNSNFTIFDKSKGGQSNKSAKVGFWFTPNKEGAEKWAGQSWWGDNEPKVYETYLNIKKPLVYKEVDNSSQIARLESELKIAEDDISSTSRGSKEYYDAYKRYNNIARQIEDLSYTDPYEQFRSHIYAMEGKSPSQANTGGVGMAMDNEDEAIKKYVEMLKGEGYDGIIIKGTDYDRNTMGSKNDQYIVFDPEQIKNVDNLNPTNNPDIRYATGLGRGSSGFDDSIERIGSEGIPATRKETLPEGWDILEEYLGGVDKRVENAIGKAKSKITKKDLAQFLDENDYDSEGTFSELWQRAKDAVDDMTMEELNYAGGGSAADIIQMRRRPDMNNIEDVYMGNKGHTGRLDAEYSDRLGISKSTTPMSDKLSQPLEYAQGDYGSGVIGLDRTWSSGEAGVSNVAHERFHAWQEKSRGFDYPEEFKKAFEELEDEIIPLLHSKDEISKYWNGRNTDYYFDRNEQEARMVQDYLEYKNHTKRYMGGKRKYEYDERIIKPFDKFYAKLRELSKKGIAIPALAGVFGLGALANKNDDKSVDNIE